MLVRLSFLAVLGVSACLVGCQSPRPAQSSSDLSRDLDAQARGVGYANAAMGAAAAFDPTGISSVGAMVAGSSMRNAMLKDADRKMRERDQIQEQELYKRYGMNPDGSPSGKPGADSDLSAQPEG